VDEKGEPHLTDFGLGALSRIGEHCQRTMEVLAHELHGARASSGKQRGYQQPYRCLWLGAVLYELLTGQPPFAGGTTMKLSSCYSIRARPRPLKLKNDRDLSKFAEVP